MSDNDILFHIVLVHPDIPNNTGNIGRLCVATKCKLHLIHPLGFSLDEKAVRRAGIDWWKDVSVNEYDDWDSFEKINQQGSYYFFSKFSSQSYFSINYKQGDYLIFGSETSGLPEAIKNKYQDSLFRIPMPGEARSLNLANSASIGIYEGIRQLNIE